MDDQIKQPQDANIIHRPRANNNIKARARQTETNLFAQVTVGARFVLTIKEIVVQ